MFVVASIEMGPLEFQTLVIDRFKKTAHLISIDRKIRADDGEAFVLVNQFWFFFFSCHFVCLVG
jgi:hypothetical protein